MLFVISATGSRKYPSKNFVTGSRRVLFVISVAMISGVLLIGEQMSFISKKDLGFEEENVLMIRQANLLGGQQEAFKTQLRTIPGVVSAGAANSMPGDFIGSNIFRSPNPEISDLRANLTQWDDDYAATMDITIVEGRGFDRRYNDSLSVLVNETAAQNLGTPNPVGLQIQSTAGTQDGPLFTIVGMVKDYNFNSLHSEVSPLVLTNPPMRNGAAVVAVRIAGSNVAETRRSIEDTWSSFVPQRAVNISFLSQDLEQMYLADRATASVFRTFTGIAILLACIGLFGLATYTIQQRTREIGIRKILGATQIGLLGLLLKNLVIILSLSLVLSIPLTWWAITKWLNNFAYHIDINPMIFLKSGLIAFIFLVVAVSYQALKIVGLNPVETLKDG